MVITLIKVEPTGAESQLMHLNTGPDSSGHRWENRMTPVYPETAEGNKLMKLRQAMNLTLRAACSRVGLTPAQWSQIEHGRYTVSEADWAALFKAIEPKCLECDAVGHGHWKAPGEKPFWLCVACENELLTNAAARTASFAETQQPAGGSTDGR